MYKLLGAILLVSSITACTSSGPLVFGERKFVPTASEAEMAENSRKIEEIENHARQMNTDDFKTLVEGNRVLIDAAKPQTVILK